MKMWSTLLSLVTTIITVVIADVSDFRFVPYEGVVKTVDNFTLPGVVHYSQFLFDTERFQLLVGARDALFRLSLNPMTRLEVSRWPAPVDRVRLCETKGRSSQDCHNYVKVLLSHGGEVFTCGTRAFSPICTKREIENLNHITDTESGIAKCPYGPGANVTSLISVDGDYYIGTPTDFSNSNYGIYRSGGTSKMLRTKEYNGKWLDEPQFVGSFENEQFIYFVFRENAVEDMNFGKQIYSRIARVCKKDQGGDIMLKDNWTTFLKARLNCSLPGEYPFYFHEIQDMVYVPSEETIYTVFNTPDNSILGAAVCAFNMTAVRRAFDGPFKYQSSSNSAWSPVQQSHQHDHFHCQSQGKKHDLVHSEKYQLMNEMVQPATVEPIYTKSLQRFTHIAVDIVATRLHKTVHVVYVSTEDGFVHKLSILPRTAQTCLVEIIQPFPVHSPRKIEVMKYLSETKSLYLGTDREVLRVPAERCSRFFTRDACLHSMDPYCGWNILLQSCTVAPNRNPLRDDWEQEVTRCPVLTDPVDGRWSNWTDWYSCIHRSDDWSYNGSCSCRHRVCSNPAPRNGGQDCVGDRIEVTRCMRNGQWTEWSGWSACSQTCGVAIKSRKRTCGNPTPANGGQVCVGRDREEIYCTNLPPCPALESIPINGGWSDWGPWSDCSARCNGGFRTRRRSCTKPAPENNGRDCLGCGVEYGSCNTQPCREERRVTPWTPWLQVNGTGGTIIRRYRFSCRAPVSHQDDIKIGSMRSEEKHCDGLTCLSLDSVEDDGWSEWSSWSPCSVECGGGHQARERHCERASRCRGSSEEKRVCNLQPCQAEWSCWSDWSPCSVMCGQGTRSRTRNCLSQTKGLLPSDRCHGMDRQQEDCQMPSCASLNGWNDWSSWSSCDQKNAQHRTRICKKSDPRPDECVGSHTESRICQSDPYISGSKDASSANAGAMVGVFLAGVIVGAIVSPVMYHYIIKKKRLKLPSSPHYLSAKPNHYVTVPTAEQKNGTLDNMLKNGATKIPMVEYETATIKRNSGGHSHCNGTIRANLSSDDIFMS